MQTLQVEAPAKINLCLHVLGRRLDGYHELAMAMQRVDLCDLVEVSIAEGDGITVICDGLDLGGEENIAAKAARLFLTETGFIRRVSIRVEKHIPVAAGLGGGSSDAAAVLMTMNRLLGQPLCREDLLRCSASLGADVPFFIFESPAWATGTGTALVRLPVLPQAYYLILHPDFAVSTPWVYESLELTKGSKLANLPRFSVATIPDLVAALHNDLEDVTARQYPEIDLMKQQLLAEGAAGALMSGSGASVFGVFHQRKVAEQACINLQAQTGWRVYMANPI